MRFVPAGILFLYEGAKNKFCDVQGNRVIALVESLVKSKGVSTPRER